MNKDFNKVVVSFFVSRYACELPAISPETQQPLNCNVDNSVTGSFSSAYTDCSTYWVRFFKEMIVLLKLYRSVACKVANGIHCSGLLNGTQFFHLLVSTSRLLSSIP